MGLSQSECEDNLHVPRVVQSALTEALRAEDLAEVLAIEVRRIQE